MEKVRRKKHIEQTSTNILGNSVEKVLCKIVMYLP